MVTGFPPPLLRLMKGLCTQDMGLIPKYHFQRQLGCPRAASVYQRVYTSEALVSQPTHFHITHAHPTMF